MAVFDNEQKWQEKLEQLENENRQLQAEIKAFRTRNSYRKQLLDSQIRIMQRLNIITFTSDYQLTPLSCYGAVKKITGYDADQFLSGMIKWEQLVHPEDLPSFHAYRQRILDNRGDTHILEYRIISGEGQIYWLQDMTAPVNDEAGQSMIIQGLIFDVSRRKLAEEDILERQAHLDSILNSVQDVIWSVTPDTFDLLYINPAAEKLYASADNDTDKAASLSSIVRKELLLENFDTLLSRGSFEAEYCVKLPHGEERWLQRRAHFARDAHGLVARIDGIDTDITRRKKAEDALRYISLHDSLTDLFNRFYFEQELQQIDKGSSETAGLIVCDVDGLKLVNDQLGHEAGDHLLVQCANLLKDCFKNDAIIARIGGDEFTVLLRDCSSEDLESALVRLRRTITSYNETHPDFPISMSIGQAKKQSAETSMSEVFRMADDIMYLNKFSNR